MPIWKKELIEQHIKTHSQCSNEDRAAVTVVERFLGFDGRINTGFSKDDKWPNHDGSFEFVPNPLISRRPEQCFIVQIKGTHIYREKNGIVKYSLPDLAFPAFIFQNVTLDPGILFVVLNPDHDGEERVFWKYMSIDFINSINYAQNSITIHFEPDDELRPTNTCRDAFCARLMKICDRHSFIRQLDNVEYTRTDIEKRIQFCNRQITESIDQNDTRDNVSRRILTLLEHLCAAVLLLNALDTGRKQVTLQWAWERSLLSIETKYLGYFLRGLRYIGLRVADTGQSERLMLKYYEFLWQIRKTLRERYGMSVLHNLEQFPLQMDKLDVEYYRLAAAAVDSVRSGSNPLCTSRFYVQKVTPFFIEGERYYEVTLQLAGTYATKYNRITAYTKANISTSYSVQLGYTDAEINLWGVGSKIKVITNWKVSIEPVCLNKLGKILKIRTKLTSKYSAYAALMEFLTRTGLNLLDLIDLQDDTFTRQIDSIYQNTNTSAFKEVLLTLKNDFSASSGKCGQNVIRYLLLNLREETLDAVMVNQYRHRYLCEELNLSGQCLPFDRNPFISNLPGSRTSEASRIGSILRIVNDNEVDVVRPYLTIRSQIQKTGEIYFDANTIASKEEIQRFNARLDTWERAQGCQIKEENGLVYIDSYEKSTIYILRKLLELSSSGNKGQLEFNRSFIKQNGSSFNDPLKLAAIEGAFVDSRLLLIYGAAGTGKTTLINYLSNMVAGRRKLFLTKTHTALQNLKQRIENPGISADFVSIDSFTKKVSLADYDIIFVDECSTIDNRTMSAFLKKLDPDTFLVLAGDIYQIESIEFGNWFFYAKDIIKTHGANVELLNTWRTEEKTLINLWQEVRNRDALISERLVIDGPFSENIGSSVLHREEEDEVILCLNYDGKFGLNNMNSYFQNANSKGSAVPWQEWTYKIGDPILFNDTKRFPILHNNLKGRIVEIDPTGESISFTVDVEKPLTEVDCQKAGLEFIDARAGFTRIRFSVYTYNEETSETDIETLRMKSVIPFQLAYAVSIHKAQGLEYDSVKVIIPNTNSEKITHGIFYTAITRAKKKLKLYWSPETMQEVVKGFFAKAPMHKSLAIVRSKLIQDE